jgi:hypothetical protein
MIKWLRIEGANIINPHSISGAIIFIQQNEINMKYFSMDVLFL